MVSDSSDGLSLESLRLSEVSENMAGLHLDKRLAGRQVGEPGHRHARQSTHPAPSYVSGQSLGRLIGSKEKRLAGRHPPRPLFFEKGRRDSRHCGLQVALPRTFAQT